MTAATSPSRTVPAIERYVAVGDSFSAGIGAPGEVPWPELVVDHLGGPEFTNLAVAGATSAEVEAGQLEAAVTVGADLITVICGGNDVLLELRPDLSGLRPRLDRMLESLVAAEGDPLVVTATYPEAGRFLDLGPRTRRRMREGLDQVNGALRDSAAAHGVLCLEWATVSRRATPDHYADDGVHPSPLGHREAAEEFSAALLSHLSREEEDR